MLFKLGQKLINGVALKIIFGFSGLVLLNGCSGSSGADAIDKAIGLIRGDGPVLTAVPSTTLQQEQTLLVDISNVKSGAPGTDDAMTYLCTWDRTVDGSVTSTSSCETLPGTLATFSGTTGILKWTPSTSELGDFEIKVQGTNKDGNDSRVFSVGVRLKFQGIESITNVKGDRMDLSWTANPSAAAYQIMKKNVDGTFSLYQTISDPNSSGITLTGLTPLQAYSWKVFAIDPLGNNDGNAVYLSAVTTDLIRLEITASDTQLSPGQTTAVTLRFKDSSGSYLTTTGMTVSFMNDGPGTSTGVFSAVNDIGDGSYTTTFTATTPGTLVNISASIPQYHFVQQRAPMTVRPLQIEITSSGTTLNPSKSVTLTAKVRDFNGQLMAVGGHGLSFSYSGGTSTGTFSAVTDHNNGSYTAIFTAGTAGTAITFGAAVSTTSSLYSTVSLTVQPWKIEVTSALSDVSVTRTTMITAKIKDWQNNYLTTGGLGLTLAISGVTGTASVGSTTDVGDGTYTAILTGLSVGTAAVTGSTAQSYAVTQLANLTIRKLRLEFLTSIANLMPGQVANITARVKDWQGNLVGVGGQGLAMSTTGGTSTGTLGTITDNSNGTYTTTFTAGSAGTATTITGTIADSYQVDTTASVTVQKWRIAVAASASTVPVGQSITLTATIKDYLGVQATAGGQTIFFSAGGGTSSGTLGSVTDNGNGTYTTTLTGVTPGTATTVTASLAQSYQVDTTASVTVQAIRLLLSTSASSLNPGKTVTVSAQVQDASGNNLTTGSYTIGFSVAGGTTAGNFSSTTSMGSGVYQATFSGTGAGTAVTLSANASVSYTVATPQPTLTVVPWKIEISSAATTVPIGQETTLTAKIKDWQNSYLTTGGDNLSILLSTAGRGSLSPVIDNGDGTYTTTFSASGVGTTAVTGALSQSYQVTVSPTLSVTAIRLLVTTSAASLNPGKTVTVSAQVQDSLGNNITAGSYTIGFAISGGTSTGTFSSTTSLGNGLYQATFSGVGAGTAVTVEATASVAHTAGTPQPTLTVVPWKIELSSTLTTIAVGQTATLTGKIKDWQNNYVTTGGDNLAILLGTAGRGSLSAILDNGDGTYTTTFSASGVGTTTVVGSLAQSYTVTVSPTLTVTGIRIALSATQTSMNPGESVTITAQIKDSAGNNLTTGSYSLGFAISGGTSTGTFGTTLSLGLGLYSVQFQGLVAGTAVTATANASTAYTVDNTITLNVVPWKVEIAASQTGYVINEVGTLTAQVKDWQNNVVTTGGKSLALSLATAGIGTIGATTDNSNGTYTASFQAGGQGSATVSVSMPQSYQVTVTPTLTVEKVYLHVTVGSPEVNSSSVHSGDTIIVTARLKNSSGNLVTGTGYVVNFSVGSGTSSVLQSAVVESSTGIYRANFQGVLAGTALTITSSATTPYIVASTASLTVTPGTAISASGSALTASANSVRSGNTITMTATMKDAAGNPMTGLTGIAFSNVGGTSTGTFGSVTEIGSGAYQANFTGGVSGTPTTVRATYGGTTVSQTAAITVTSGNPTKLTVTGPASMYANTCSTAFHLSFFDSGDNSTTLSATTNFVFGGQGTARFFTDSSCTNEISQLSVLGGLATSQDFFMRSYDYANLSLTFTAAGITQSPASHAISVIGVASWLGLAGVVDTLGSLTTTNFYYAPSRYDGGFQTPWGLTKGTISGVSYLFVTDTTEHTVTKIRMSDGQVIGKIGRLAGTTGSIPLTGGSNCTGLSLNAGNINGWCPGGTYQSGNIDGAFNTPAGIVYLGGYLYVADNANHRIIKIDADSGAWVGWNGKISSSPSSGTCSGQTGTASTWCLGGSGTATSSSQITTPTANVAYGTTSTGSNGGNEYRNPSYIATDGTNLYVNDSGNDRLVKINPSNGQLIGWMGWVLDNSGMNCASGNTPGNSVTNTATEFTDSWCTGGRSTSLSPSQVAGGAANWIKINIGWQTMRSISFYDDGTNNFMYVSASGTGRIMRYTAAQGYYRGWTGRSANLTGGAGVPSAPPGIASLMTGVCSTTAQAYTMGWCYGGGGQGASNTNGLTNPFGIRIDATTGTMYVANSAAANVMRLNLATGVFSGYIGRVSATPTGGSSGCSTTASGSPTPGWCTGGTTTSGYGFGTFSRLDSSGGGTDGMIDIEIDSNDRIYTVDRNNYRINVHEMSSGEAKGAIGLRVNALPSVWTSAFSGNPVMSFLQSTLVLNRDPLLNGPWGISISGNYMYVADTGTHRIKRYLWDTGAFDGWIGVMSVMSPTGGDESCIGATVGGMTPNWCKGGGSTSTTSTGFNSPRDMVSDGSSLYVADTSNHRLARVRASDGLFLGWMGGVAAAGTPADSLYDVSGCTSASNPNTTPHFCLGGASGASALPSGFNTPRALDGFTDIADGFTPNHYYVIVADSGNNRIQKIDVTAGASKGWVGRISTGTCGTAGTATTGWCLNGTVNNSDTSSLINNARMGTPAGVWIDTSASPIVVYVTDAANGKILKFNASTGAFLGWTGRFGNSTTNHGCGAAVAINSATPGWCTGGNASTGTLDGEYSSPTGISGDANYLYVTDLNTHRVNRINKSTGVFAGWKGRILTAPSSPTDCANAGVGNITPDWCFGGSAQMGYAMDSNVPSKAAGFDTPRGIQVRGNYLIIIDSNNNRIVQIPKN